MSFQILGPFSPPTYSQACFGSKSLTRFRPIPGLSRILPFEYPLESLFLTVCSILIPLWNPR